MSEQFSIGELLLEDNDDFENNTNQNNKIKKEKMNFIGGGVDIDKEPENGKDNNLNKNIIDKDNDNDNSLNNIINKKEPEKQILPKFNNNNKNNAFSNFVFSNVLQFGNTNQNQNENQNNQNEIQNNQNILNNNINAQKNKNPSSLLSSQSLDKKTINRYLDTSSHNNNIYNNNVIPNQTQMKKDKDKYSIKKSYLIEQNSELIKEQIQRYKDQREEIITKYKKTLDDKDNELRGLREYYKEEMVKLEGKCQIKIETQKEYLKEYETKIEEQKNKLLTDKISKIKENEEIYKNKLAREFTFLDEKNNTEMKNITNLHEFEIQKIDQELEKIRAQKENLKKKEKAMNINDFYGEITKKLTMNKGDLELKANLDKQKSLEKENDEKKQELEDKMHNIKETIELYQNAIYKLKSDHNDEINKLAKEKSDIKKSENELNNQKIEEEKIYKQKIFDIEMSQKNLESKEEEENDLRNLEQELDAKINMLFEERNIFEEEKNKIMGMLSKRNNEIKKKTEEINKEEIKLEQELNKVLAEEMEINNQLNKIKYTENNIELERMNIEKEKKNLELMEKRIEDDINNLNKDKAIMEEDKERIKNIHFEIEEQNNEVINEYKSIQRENKGLEYKTKAIENMRINNVFKNQYANEFNNNFESIGYNTSPNFGNYKISNQQNFQNSKIHMDSVGGGKNKNFSNTFTIFNEIGKKNADEYFKTLQDSLNEKNFTRNIDPNEDTDNFLMNGKNYVKNIKEKINKLENEKE